MSVVMMLDKLGKIAFNENYSNSSSMYGIKKSAVSKTTVESALNYYHVSSSLPNENHYTLDIPISDQVEAAAKVMMASNRPCLFEHYYDSSSTGKRVGHEVIVNSCKKSGSSYILDIIDPNGPTHTQKTLTKDGLFGSTQLFSAYAKSDYSVYDKIDIDTYKNTDTSGNSPAPASIEDEVSIDAVQYPGPFSTLEIALTGDFVIQNANGEYLQWSETRLDGTMEVYAVRLSPEGDDSAAIMYVDVPLSDTFHFEPLTEGMDVWFSVADPYRYSRITGVDLSTVAINKQGEMDIECSNTPLEIVYGKPELDTPLLSLKGTGNGHVNMICNDNTLKATGAISDYKIQAIDVNGNLMYNQTVTVSAAEKDVIDSSQESMMADESSREPADELIS